MADQAVLHITAALQHKSGIPRDKTMNTWTFFNPGGFGADKIADANVCITKLNAFYDNIDGVAIAQNIQTTNGLHYQVFDVSSHLDGSAAGPPILEVDHSVSPQATNIPLPNEVAIAITFKAAYGTASEFGPGGTRPRARLRSRVYIGPLPTAVVAAAATITEPIVDPATVTALRTAALTLSGDSVGGWLLGVWSRTDQAVRDVVGGWIDNAFDTQRRRGNDATLRTTF